jgi:hypothetical protein
MCRTVTVTLRLNTFTMLLKNNKKNDKPMGKGRTILYNPFLDKLLTIGASKLAAFLIHA